MKIKNPLVAADHMIEYVVGQCSGLLADLRANECEQFII